jgi:hypothetical protein
MSKNHGLHGLIRFRVQNASYLGRQRKCSTRSRRTSHTARFRPIRQEASILASCSTTRSSIGKKIYFAYRPTFGLSRRNWEPRGALLQHLSIAWRPVCCLIFHEYGSVRRHFRILSAGVQECRSRSNSSSSIDSRIPISIRQDSTVFVFAILFRRSRRTSICRCGRQSFRAHDWLGHCGV